MLVDFVTGTAAVTVVVDIVRRIVLLLAIAVCCEPR